jgi:hypothetical protein
MRIVGGRTTRIALVVAGGVLVVLLLAQLVLPSIAARRVRDRVGRYGHVNSASVSAFPAIELLWGDASSASVRATSLSMSLSQAIDLLESARGVQRLELHAANLHLGPLRVSRASIEKRGGALTLQGSLDEADLRGALPDGVEVQSVQSVPEGVEVRVGGSLFGLSASVLALVGARDGKLVAQPQGLLFAALGPITLFSNPRIAVQNVEMTPLTGGSPDGGGYWLRLSARLR